MDKTTRCDWFITCRDGRPIWRLHKSDMNMKINLWLRMKNGQCINYTTIIAWRAQSLHPLLIHFDRFPILMNPDRHSKVFQSVTSRVSSVSQPQSPEQTSRLNAHSNRTPVIFQDKWPVQTEVASTSAALQREHENHSSNTAGQLGATQLCGKW